MNAPCGNRLLDALPPAELERIMPLVRSVRLARGDATTVQDCEMQNVDLPISALLAVTGTLEDGTVYELTSVGSEGFVEIDAALGSNVAMRSAVCQFDGEVARMTRADFHKALGEAPTFQTLVLHAVRARAFITEQTVMCNAKHSIVQRLARWFALACDRLERRDFDVTHDFLSTILGVRRASVSEAVAELERTGAILRRRGVVTVHDDGALRSAACECYEFCRRALAESLGPRAGSRAGMR